MPRRVPGTWGAASGINGTPALGFDVGDWVIARLQTDCTMDAMPGDHPVWTRRRDASAIDVDPFLQDQRRITLSRSFAAKRAVAQLYVRSDVKHSRAAHIIEVALFARHCAIRMKLNAACAMAIGTAHDIGHGPASHFFETAMRRFDPGYCHATATSVLLEAVDATPAVIVGAERHPYFKQASGFAEGELVALADRICGTVSDAFDINAPDVMERLADFLAGEPCTEERLIALFADSVVATFEQSANSGEPLIGLQRRDADLLDELWLANHQAFHALDESVAAHDVGVDLIAAVFDNLSRRQPEGAHGEIYRNPVWLRLVQMTDRELVHTAAELGLCDPQEAWRHLGVGVESAHRLNTSLAGAPCSQLAGVGRVHELVLFSEC